MIGMLRLARLGPRSFGLVILAGLLLAAPNAATAASAAGSPSASQSCGPVPKLDPRNFPARPRIDNRFTPLVPGMQFVLDGYVVEDDGQRHPHRIVTTVTDLTKVVDGVRALVLFDRDIEDGLLQESEIFFEAQDAAGQVWLLGEYPEEYENGTLQGAPDTWISGVESAKAGVAMLAHPRVGSPTYLQGLALRVGFEDCATVFRTGQHSCVPTGCYNGVLEIDEFSPLDPAGGHQRKLYAPGVGNIRVVPVGGDQAEKLELTSAARLCPAEFAAERNKALQQDRRGYVVAGKVYRKTTPAADTLTERTC